MPRSTIPTAACTRTARAPPPQGKRRPTLEAVLADEQTQWTKLTVDDWYGEGPREVEVTTDTAVWYRGQTACGHPLGPDS